MVETVSPDYYASNELVGDFELSGTGFDLLPDDAIGILADDNDNPLGYRYTTSAFNLFDVNVVNDNFTRLVVRGSSSHQLPTYLGAILSSDRSRIYWINDTKPLP